MILKYVEYLHSLGSITVCALRKYYQGNYNKKEEQYLNCQGNFKAASIFKCFRVVQETSSQGCVNNQEN
jgi:hypothetical protein